MFLAFKRPETLWEYAIAIWTQGPFCHCALVFGDSLAARAGASLPFVTATPKDGVCMGTAHYTSKIWTLVQIAVPRLANDPGAMAAAQAECLRAAELDVRTGYRYDWLGILGFVLPWGEHEDADRFCSEECVRVLQSIGILKRYKAWTMSPNSLYRVLKQYLKAPGTSVPLPGEKVSTR